MARVTVEKVQNEWAQVIGEEKMAELLNTLRELVQHIGFDYIEKGPLNNT